MTETEGNNAPSEWHSITVLIIHPSWDLSRVSNDTGLAPLRRRRMGEQRLTPTGSSLPGTWADSRWSYIWTSHEEGGFEKSIQMALDRMQNARAFLNEVRASGGQLLLIVRLSGKDHQGGEICNEVITKISDLGFALGIEVFPDGL